MRDQRTFRTAHISLNALEMLWIECEQVCQFGKLETNKLEKGCHAHFCAIGREALVGFIFWGNLRNLTVNGGIISTCWHYAAAAWGHRSQREHLGHEVWYGKCSRNITHNVLTLIMESHPRKKWSQRYREEGKMIFSSCKSKTGHGTFKERNSAPTLEYVVLLSVCGRVNVTDSCLCITWWIRLAPI